MKKITDKTKGNTLESNFVYDDNGNLLSEITTDKIEKKIIKDRILKYDKYNRLTEVLEGDKVLEKNLYNFEGLRVQKEVDGKKTNYFYDGKNIVLETGVDGNVQARNVYGTKLVSRETSGIKGYYKYNGHGDVEEIINEGGTSLASYYYDSFGNITETKGDFDNPYRYSGYVYDKEVDYYYLQSRMYDPSVGRFIQEDTYRGETNDPLSLNLYTYCVNNPLIYDDPTGYWPEWVEKFKSGVKSFASDVYDGIKSIGNNIYKGVKSLGDMLNFDVLLDVVKRPFDKIKDTASKFASKTKEIYKDTKEWVKTKASEAVEFVENINIPQLITGVVSTIGGGVAFVSGLTTMALPVPGARLVGAGLMATGATSFTYGIGEMSDSTLHVNPIKDAVTSLGISEQDYHLIGAISTGGSSIGISAVSPYNQAHGGGNKVPLSSNKNTQNTKGKPYLDKPAAGDNMGNMLKGVPKRAAKDNSTVVDEYGILKNDKSISGQAHHLNQNAAYRDVIPPEKGVSVKLEGNAFTQPGTPHYDAHT